MEPMSIYFTTSILIRLKCSYILIAIWWNSLIGLIIALLECVWFIAFYYIDGNLWGMAQLGLLSSCQFSIWCGAGKYKPTCFPNHRSRNVICVSNLSQNNIGRCRCIFLRIKNCRHIDIVISTITSFSGCSSWKSNVLTLYEIITLLVI